MTAFRLIFNINILSIEHIDGNKDLKNNFPMTPLDNRRSGVMGRKLNDST